MSKFSLIRCCRRCRSHLMIPTILHHIVVEINFNGLILAHDLSPITATIIRWIEDVADFGHCPAGCIPIVIRVAHLTRLKIIKSELNATLFFL